MGVNMQAEQIRGRLNFVGDDTAIQLKLLDHRTLSELDCSDVARHFLALPKDDRLLRFMRRMEVHDLRQYALQLMSKAHAVGLAVYEGRTLAVAELYVSPGSPTAELAISVDVAARRRGIGRALVSRLIDVARRSSATDVRATTLLENTPARRLLMKCCFSLRCAGEECEARLVL